MASISTDSTPAPADELKIVQDATCTFCGCVCDDIDLKVQDNHIIEAKRACVLGKAWFLNHEIEEGPRATDLRGPFGGTARVVEIVRLSMRSRITSWND